MKKNCSPQKFPSCKSKVHFLFNLKKCCLLLGSFIFTLYTSGHVKTCSVDARTESMCVVYIGLFLFRIEGRKFIDKKCFPFIAHYLNQNKVCCVELKK